MKYTIDKVIQSKLGNKYNAKIIIENDVESHISIFSLDGELLEMGICNLNYTIGKINKMVNDIELPPLVAELEQWDGKLF
jgi:hypothetical protein